MKRVEKRKGKNQKDGEGRGETKELKRRGKNKYKQSREEEGRKKKGIRDNLNRINSRFNSFSRDPIPTERAGSIRANMNRINSRFNSSKEILYQLLQLNFGKCS